MNDPTRWNKDPRRRPVGAALLLRGVPRPRPPGPAELARLEAMIDQIPRRSMIAARRTRLAAAAAVAIFVGALGTGVWAWRGRRAPAPDAAPVLAVAETASPPAVFAAAPREPLPAGVTETRSVARPRNAAPGARPARRERAPVPAPAAMDQAPVDTLAREIALVDAARANVNREPSRTLAFVDMHRHEFPRGQLAAEREFLAVEALRRMNRTDEALRRAAELETRYPSSSYAARASRLLQSAP